jgi:CRP-like cAMP-binding protein
VAGAFEADELGDVLEVLPEYEALSLGDDGDVAHAVGEQPLAAAGVIEDVDGDEVDLLFRKKLFRSEAAASPGLGEQDELLGRDVHGDLHDELRILGARGGDVKARRVLLEFRCPAKGDSMQAELAARLRALPVFAELTQEQFSALCGDAQVQAAQAGDVLIRQNDVERDYLVVLDGELEVTRQLRGPGGVEQVKVGHVKPGAGVGEMALLSAVPRRASVCAVTPVRYLRIAADRLDEMLAMVAPLARQLRADAQLRFRMNLVRQAAAFRPLPLERVHAAFESLRPVPVDAGETVVRQGDPGDTYYLIEAGQAEVWRKDPVTDETACVATLGPGQGFGEEALIMGGFRNATVTMTSAGTLLALDGAAFNETVRRALVEEVEPASARELAASGGCWIDCRYDMEFEESRIPGAQNLPLDELRERAGTLDPSRRYLVYCRSGRRSAVAAFLLRERGFAVCSLKGGIVEWPYEVEGDATGH